MKRINQILEYGLLAEFAYLRLEDEWFKENNVYISSPIGKYKIKEQGSIYNHHDVVNFLNGLDINGNEKKLDLKLMNAQEISEVTDIKPDRVNEMIKLLDDYIIKGFASDSGFFSSGFQGMLLQNNTTKEYVIAFRGTAGLKDIAVDSQLALLTSNHNFQYNEAVDFVELMQKRYKISYENLTLTGHSLGGILSQSVGSRLKIKAFAYNPLGTSVLEKVNSTNILYQVLTKLGIESHADEEWINKNIITLSYNDIGLLNGDILSNLASSLNASKHLGIKIDFYGKNVGVGEGHSIITMNKLLASEAEENLTTIEDIKSYNKEQKTLFLEFSTLHKLDATFMMMENKKCLFSVQTREKISDKLTQQKRLINELNGNNIDSFMINAEIEQAEDKDHFKSKLYYNFNDNKLKVKTKDFNEAKTLMEYILPHNENLKKHDIKVQLQGSH